MKSISFLVTGDELLSGDQQDTNTLSMAKSLMNAGCDIRYKLTCGDAMEDLVDAISFLQKKTNLIICCGGLGPTSDDNTRFAIAKAFNLELTLDDASFSHIKARLSSFKLRYEDNNKKQALFPIGATILDNNYGTANGCHILVGDLDIFMLPGPPRECLPMFSEYVLPLILEKGYSQEKYLERFLVLGLPEGEISQKVDDLLAHLRVNTAYRWDYPYLEIKILGQDKALMREAISLVMPLLEPFLVSRKGKTAIEHLSTLLAKQKATLTLYVATAYQQLFQSLSPDYINLKNIDELKGDLARCFCVKITEKENTAEISLDGFMAGQVMFQAKFETPRRGPEVNEFYLAFIAWQLEKALTLPELSTLRFNE